MNRLDFSTGYDKSGFAYADCRHCQTRFSSNHTALSYEELIMEMEARNHVCPGVDNAENLRAIRATLEMMASFFASDTALINYIDERVREKMAKQADANVNTISPKQYGIMTGQPPPQSASHLTKPKSNPSQMTDAELHRRGL